MSQYDLLTDLWIKHSYSNIGYVGLYIFVTDLNNKLHVLNNSVQLINMLQNNTIHTIELYHNFYKVISCDELTKLLKYNTSVDKIKIIFSYDESVKSECDFYNNCSKLLFDIFKTNKSIKYVELTNYIITNENLTHMFNVLKINDTIKHLTITLRSIDTVYLVDLIKNNNTLEIIKIFTNFTIRKEPYIDQLVDAIKYNSSITSIYICIVNIQAKKEQKILKYCDRNKYNARLKRLMIQDV
jgi:hypothetical protein